MRGGRLQRSSDPRSTLPLWKSNKPQAEIVPIQFLFLFLFFFSFCLCYLIPASAWFGQWLHPGHAPRLSRHMFNNRTVIILQLFVAVKHLFNLYRFLMKLYPYLLTWYKYFLEALQMYQLQNYGIGNTRYGITA